MLLQFLGQLHYVLPYLLFLIIWESTSSVESVDISLSIPFVSCILAPSCDCQQEHTEWDKLFIMLENSQMKENMLLQSVDEILKVEMQTLRVEMMQFVANFAGMSTTAIEKISSQLVLQVDQLMKNNKQVHESKNLQASEQGEFLEELLLLNHNVSKRLGQLESVWQQRTEAEAQAFPQQDKSTYTREDNFILNSLWQELQETRTELKQSQKWAAQHLLPAGKSIPIFIS